MRASETLQERGTRVSADIKQHYDDGVPEKDIGLLLSIKYGFPISLNNVKKQVSTVCIRGRYKTKSSLADVSQAGAKNRRTLCAVGTGKNYKRPVNVKPRTPKAQGGSEGFLTFKLEAPTQQQHQNRRLNLISPPESSSVSIAIDNAPTTPEKSDDDARKVMTGEDVLHDDVLSDTIDHEYPKVDLTFITPSHVDPAFTKLGQINAGSILGNILEQTAWLDHDLLTVNNPFLYWGQYGAFFDGCLISKYTDHEQGNRRLFQPTIDLQCCLMEKSVRLMTTILRIAFLQCEASLQPVLKVFIKQLIIAAKRSPSAVTPILPYLKAVYILMDADVEMKCAAVGVAVNQLTILSNVSFYAKYELWELYITLLRESKAYCEAQRQCRMLLNASEISSGQHSADTYRTLRLSARISMDQIDLDLAAAVLEALWRTSIQHALDYTDNGCYREWSPAEDLYKIKLQQGLMDQAIVWLQEATRYSFLNYAVDSGNNLRILAEWEKIGRTYDPMDTALGYPIDII